MFKEWVEDFNSFINYVNENNGDTPTPTSALGRWANEEVENFVKGKLELEQVKLFKGLLVGFKGKISSYKDLSVVLKNKMVFYKNRKRCIQYTLSH